MNNLGRGQRGTGRITFSQQVKILHYILSSLTALEKSAARLAVVVASESCLFSLIVLKIFLLEHYVQRLRAQTWELDYLGSDLGLAT